MKLNIFWFLDCNWSHLQTSIWTLGSCRRHFCPILQSEQLQITICLNISVKSERGIIQAPLLTFTTPIIFMFTWLLCQTIWLILPLLKGQRLYYFLCLLFRRATTRKCPLVACLCCCSASHQVPRPGVASPLLLFSSIQQLPHWLTDWPTADFKNPANRLRALLLLVTDYCCFLRACLSTDVIKNRKGLNFNGQQKRSWNTRLSYNSYFNPAAEMSPTGLFCSLCAKYWTLVKILCAVLWWSEGKESDWLTSRLMCCYGGSVSLHLMDSSVSD